MASPSTLASPSSDARLWSALRGRIDSLLEERQRRTRLASLPASSVRLSHLQCAVESESRKRLREDSLLLIRGFDSVSSSLEQLNEILNAAAQGARDLAKPSSTEVLKRESQALGSGADVEEPERKKLCSSTDEFAGGGGSDVGLINETEQSDYCLSEPATKDQKLKEEEAEEGKGTNDGNTDQGTRNGKLEMAKKLAVSMSATATSLARELRKLKSELGFVQERCTLLEEENRQLRDNFELGLRPDEDDLVRLQLEALLAEKSRLANENATLKRENQCLHQLVEYHQLTSLQELSPDSYQHAVMMQGTCLDFSPFATTCSDVDDDNGRCYDEAAEEEAADPPSRNAPRDLSGQFEKGLLP